MALCDMQLRVVLPMYMGVILLLRLPSKLDIRAPHVYGGDPKERMHKKRI